MGAQYRETSVAMKTVAVWAQGISSNKSIETIGEAVDLRDLANLPADIWDETVADFKLAPVDEERPAKPNISQTVKALLATACSIGCSKGS